MTASSAGTDRNGAEVTVDGPAERDGQDRRLDVGGETSTAWVGLAEQSAALTRRLLDAGSVEEVLRQIVAAAAVLVPGVDVASVTLRDGDGAFHTPVATDRVAEKLDSVQYDSHEGPCVECARPDGPGWVVSPELLTEQRWPRFGPAAADLGMRAVLATAIPMNHRPPELSGALNLYSFAPAGLSDTDRDVLLLLASHASLALAHTAAVTSAELEGQQLRAAVDSRDVIGQAKGILMQRRGIGADEAFAVLRRTSQNLNVKLVDLATELARRHTELGPPEAE
ncbi:ANTAR domain-containing protein [Saccharomonospora piscinae]|uniref:ANTAR domain-containing protein n=1 Tax=Saccharomonospora piscinae TaxID=687388 RepID=UPI0009BE6949|nr:ANTAR domain-containing protein [Saccharomonospora piscinae]